MICPICGAAGVARDQGVFGWLAHCGGCYEGDPEAQSWRHIQARADSPDEALELWIERAREYADGGAPPLTCPYVPVDVYGDLSVQIMQESKRTRGWRLIREGRALVFRPC